jgi:hypothetical protein
MMSRSLWLLVIVIATGLVGISIYQTFQHESDAAGWVQVGIAALGVPILLRELYQIRQAINQKPVISVGLANVKDLPLSKIREAEHLKTTLDVSHGYPHFWLVVRNSGKTGAKSVKIHIEYIRSDRKSLYLPVIEVSDWLGDNRYTFKKVNNADFVFIGGSDWILHANDSDMFDFDMTTAIVKQREPEIREFPEVGNYEFTCTVWADGLDKPVVEKMIVNIVDKKL